MKDLRFALRQLMKNPGFTLVAVIALALGIGANTAIFSVVHSVLLRPLPFKDPDHLVWVWGVQPQLDRAPHSPADFLDYQSQNSSFEQMAAFRPMSFTLTGEGQPEMLNGMITSANYFSLLGLNAARGRVFSEEDGVAGASRKAVLSHALWQRQFGGDPGVIGKPITLNGESVTVIGVILPSVGSRQIEIWLNPRQVVPDFTPNSTEDLLTMRNNNYLNVFARLKPSVGITQAQTDLDAVHKRIEDQYPLKSSHRLRLVPMHELVTGEARPALLALLGAVGLVLLIACANVANLMLARAASRQKEIAIRQAMGASRLRIIRQLLTESAMLSALGGGLGWLLAWWGVDVMVALSPPDTPRVQEIGLDRYVLLFTLGVSLLTTILFGLVPALLASRVDLNETLKEGGRASVASRRPLRSALVISEIALALVVLIGAGLLVQSFARVLSADSGFKTENIMTGFVWLSDSRYEKADSCRAFLKEMVARLEALPGVEGVAVCNDLPVAGTDTTSNPTIEGRPPFSAEDQVLVGRHVINARYFEAMGIPLLKGRAFTERDREKSSPVLIINEAMARALFPDDDPVGKRIRFGTDDEWREIVGVAGDVKWDGLQAGAGFHSYAPHLQEPWPYLNLAVRSPLDSHSLIAAVRREIQSIDSALPVSSVRTMDEVIAETIAPRRFSMMLFSLFAVVALLLVAVGIYGVMSYSVSQRTHELGIRMALGASRGDVMRIVVRHAMAMTVAGIAAGTAAALGATRLMESMLFEVETTDPMTFIAVAVLLLLVAFASCYLPARRATRVDPMTALRCE
ncbi:MAG: ABC transporter permease [Acidobacteriota bacterium]